LSYGRFGRSRARSFCVIDIPGKDNTLQTHGMRTLRSARKDGFL
jgi:hypothetical protein